MRTVRIFATFALFAAPFLAAGFAQAQQDQTQTGDPVADAARKAREAKKAAPKPKKVFTDDDIASKPVADASAAAAGDGADQGKGGQAGAAEAQAKKAKNGDEPEDQTNSEAAWRGRFAAQRKKIADAEAELDVLQREVEKANVQYYPDPQKAMKEQFTREEINAKNDKIAEKKKQIEAFKQQLSELEDKLRVAGGDPGWAR